LAWEILRLGSEKRGGMVKPAPQQGKRPMKYLILIKYLALLGAAT
jgi:hypothetical protein